MQKAKIQIPDYSDIGLGTRSGNSGEPLTSNKDDIEVASTQGAMRRYHLGRASDLKPQKAKWLWGRRIPLGELTLLAGREGVGKSTFAYFLVAEITKGAVPGVFKGQPREVIVLATEDSWEHTIIPRLMAAGANLDLVRFIRVDTTSGERELSLLDFALLKEAIIECNAAMVLLDPLMSRFQNADTHKDAEVRAELEPVVKVAHDTGCAVLGLIHVNKGQSPDVLNTIMGSRAFTAVPRSVLFVMTDPKDENVKLFGQAKSNLGPKVPGSRGFTIVTEQVPAEGGEKIVTSRLVWGATDMNRSLDDIQSEARRGRSGPSVPEQAAEWVESYLRQQPEHSALLKEIEEEAKAAGFSTANLHAARRGSLEHRIVSQRARVKGGAATWTLVDTGTLRIGGGDAARGR